MSRSFEDSGGRSPLIIKDLDLYPQPPANTRSPTLNSEEPQNSGTNRASDQRVQMRRKGVLAPIDYSALFFERDDSVVETEDALLLRVGSNTGVAQGGVLIAAERENRLVHVNGVEDSKVYKQVEVSH